ncbi:MAG: hypothetical protein HGA23_10380 [Bacteroidales bacterium]|nr:hypothetical protein [Bacteroidales bacterium]
MKKSIIIFMAALSLSGCARHYSEEDISGNWNGYEQYLKTGESFHTLWAGKNINIGTVTYGIDNEANFYVTYDCSASGWLISETHMYAGDKAKMPLNKPGAPKIGLFPNSGFHNPRVSTYTYRVPLVQLPPCASPGFVVASHCVVKSPAGKTETAWAEGNYTFSDKGWGWFDDYYYDPPQEQLSVLYGTAYNNDTLKLFHLDVTHKIAELMLVEYVGNTPGHYDGAAYDYESGIFFFTKVTTNELWLNQLHSEDPSFCAGTLSGTSSSGTFHNGEYYYVNEIGNTINEVSFNESWIISDETILDTIPGQVVVNDIAMNPAGDLLYMMGQYNGGGSELITWEVTDRIFRRTSINVEKGAQITFGSDGRLYAVASAFETDSANYIYIIECTPDSLSVIIDDIIYIEDPFSDLSGGGMF